MKAVLLCLCALVLTSCAANMVQQGRTVQRGSAPRVPPPPPPPPSPPPPNGHSAGETGYIAANCPLSVGFASYGAGIDGTTRSRVEALLVSDRTVTGFQAHRWGREGEVTLCVRTRAPADAARLFAAIRLIVPARPRGPISLHTPAGLDFETPPPR